MKTYDNRWISDQVLDYLSECGGRILDLGGGLAPYYQADVVADIEPYDAGRLSSNQWGMPEAGTADGDRWAQMKERYVRIDATREKLPFADKEFDVGLCSHMLEDVDEPFFALDELNRVCKEVAIVSTSRILEQTRGIDHPRKCGYDHHVWMLEHEGEHVTFTRKSDLVEQSGCHIRCPPGQIMTRKDGVFFVAGTDVQARERKFKSRDEEVEALRSFVSRFQSRMSLFEADKRARSLKYWVWRFKQRVLGAE